MLEGLRFVLSFFGLEEFLIRISRILKWLGMGSGLVLLGILEKVAPDRYLETFISRIILLFILI
jgi:hypothetical protein